MTSLCHIDIVYSMLASGFILASHCTTWCFCFAKFATDWHTPVWCQVSPAFPVWFCLVSSPILGFSPLSKILAQDSWLWSLYSSKWPLCQRRKNSFNSWKKITVQLWSFPPGFFPPKGHQLKQWPSPTYISVLPCFGHTAHFGTLTFKKGPIYFMEYHKNYVFLSVVWSV